MGCTSFVRPFLWSIFYYPLNDFFVPKAVDRITTTQHLSRQWHNKLVDKASSEVGVYKLMRLIHILFFWFDILRFDGCFRSVESVQG